MMFLDTIVMKTGGTNLFAESGQEEHLPATLLLQLNE